MSTQSLVINDSVSDFKFLEGHFCLTSGKEDSTSKTLDNAVFQVHMKKKVN